MDLLLCHKIRDNISRVIVGKSEAIELLIVALMAEGHVLIEDVPGLGKTLLAKTLAKTIGGTFRRVQFTPDLLPTDITGFNIYHQQTGQFVFQPGPVMSHVLLADEINRTIPRTQSALLESMEERQVTIDGKTYPLPSPFFVIATQNPIELEGTFLLPEAQMDRFLLKIKLGYPNHEEEMTILQRFQKEEPFRQIEAVTTPEEVGGLQRTRKEIYLSEPVKKYITDLAWATRTSPYLRLGVSPRGSLALMKAAQALAALRGRNYVLPDDIKYLCIPVLAHRLMLKEEERLRGETPETILRKILTEVPIPIPIKES